MSEQYPVYTIPGCPLWTDTTNSSFNVDDPTFWPPMPVISGIASGFCERMAVAKLASAGEAVVAGAKATLVPGITWTIGATTDPSLGSNNAIVSNVANGFATGVTGAALYNTHNATFQVVGTSAGANYMKAVDNAITSMVTMQDSYVDDNGTAYTFNTLATAATTRATARGSSIQTPVEGGTNFNAPFAPAYPVEWAKERKWMLDQLHITGASVGGVAAGQLKAYYISGSATTANVFTSTGTFTGSGAFVDLSLLSGSAGGTKDGAVAYRLDGTFTSQTDTNINATVYLDIPAMDGGDFDQRNIDYSSLTRVTDITTRTSTTTDQSYHVEAGGHLIIDTNANAETVVIDSGGTVSLRTGASITSLSEFPGGVLIPSSSLAAGASVGTIYLPTTTKIAYGFILPEAEWRESIGSCTYYHAGTTNITNATAATADQVWIDNGAVVNLTKRNTGNCAYISGGTLTMSSATNEDGSYLYRAIVDNGGLLTLSAGCYVEHVCIRSGGSVIAYGGTLFNCDLESGGYLRYAANCSIAVLDAYDGATLDAYAGPTTPVTLTFIPGGRGAYFHHFCTYGIVTGATTTELDTSSGWNTFNCTRIGATSDYVIAGVTDSATGLTTIRNYVNAGLSATAARIPGKVVSGSVDAASPEAGFKGLYPTKTSVLYGVRATAKNRRPDSDQEDHYKDFRVRQYTDFTPST